MNMKETKENHDRRRAAGIIAGSISLALLVSSALLVTVYAQSVSQKDPVDAVGVASKHLGTVPSSHSSDSKVTLRFTFDNGAVFTVTQYEGAMIRVERGGSTFGIATHIDTEHANRVTAKILKVLPVTVLGGIVDEGTVEISSVELGKNPLELPIGELGAKVEVISIAYDVGASRERKTSSRVHLLDEGGGIEAGGDPQCCLTCSGITFCGCRVSASCGSCCVGSCC